jgi:hypothetical protein
MKGGSAACREAELCNFLHWKLLLLFWHGAGRFSERAAGTASRSAAAVAPACNCLLVILTDALSAAARGIWNVLRASSMAKIAAASPSLRKKKQNLFGLAPIRFWAGVE